MSDKPDPLATKVVLREAMATMVPNVPPGFDWGWFFREDPRMHLQTTDDEHLNQYKVWLEHRGQRAFEVAKGPLPSKVEKALKSYLRRSRDGLEMKWIRLMLKKRWMAFRVEGDHVVLTAYPQSASAKFERKVEIAKAFSPGPKDPEKFAFNEDEVTLEYRDGPDVLDLSLVDVIFQGS